MQVYVLRALVQVVQKSGTERLQWWWATILVVAMLVTSETQSISQHLCFTFGQRFGMRARATIAMAVFKKVLDIYFSQTHMCLFCDLSLFEQFE